MFYDPTTIQEVLLNTKVRPCPAKTVCAIALVQVTVPPKLFVIYINLPVGGTVLEVKKTFDAVKRTRFAVVVLRSKEEPLKTELFITSGLPK